MSVDPATAKHKAEHAGRPIISAPAAAAKNSSPTPRDFSREPAHAPAGPAHEHAHHATARPRRSPRPPGAIYTCPMHPQIRQDHPGACPICGMALEPEVATEATGPSAELVDMTRRFWVALALSIPVFALEMGGHLVGPASVRAGSVSNWIQLALATPVALWAGWPFFERGWASLKSRNLNMFTLIAMGVGVAWAYSVVATVAPGLFPPAFRGDHGAVAVYFEAAAVITTLVLLGQVLELQGARTDGRRDPRAARSRAKDRAARPRATARTRRSRSTRSKIGDRLARPAGREGPGGRRRSSRGEARSMNPC